MNNYSRVLTITLVMLFNLNAIAQKKQVAKFQYTIAQAVKKHIPQVCGCGVSMYSKIKEPAASLVAW
ncbi:hypothetical protein [Pedobacter sp. P26]|uniref:hypothetical protein n=1 Tax=Pedobacter sp. P26 TaxID=3423956 RepID=UPI003D66E951